MQQRTLPGRQAGKISVLYALGGDNGMVVADLGIVNDLGRIAANRYAGNKGHGLGNGIYQHWQTPGHIGSEIPAVCPGIGR